MHEIKMPKPKTCSVCSIAMLAGISYDDAVRLSFGAEPEDFSMSLDRMEAALVKAGLKTRRLSKMPKNPARNMLVECKSKSEGWWHYIVYDATRKKFLDPIPNGRPLEDYELYSCIEIL